MEYNIEGGVNGEDVENFLDVGFRYLVARIWHGAVTLRLSLQFSEQLPLSRYLHHLIEHHAVGVGHFGKKAVTLRLSLQFSEQLPLSRYLHHLIEHHAVGVGHFGKKVTMFASD